MSLITHILSQDGELINATVDFYGDQEPTSSSSVQCRFRYITELDRTTNIEGESSADAIIWFEPDVVVKVGSIVKADGEYWRVEKLIKARRMSGSQIMFLKALVKKHELADDFS
jgi:hypothetical protein